MIVPENIHSALLATLMAIVFLSFLVVALRNIITTVQLGVAAYAFYTRVKPTSRRQQLWNRYSDLSIPVSIIAPCYNEELAIVDSIQALIGLEYPDHEIVVVNDGSSDSSLQVMIDEFALEKAEREPLAVLSPSEVYGVYVTAKHPNLIVIDKQNGRKADAVNVGIGYATAPLICIIDADSVIEPDGLLRATEPFMWDDGSLVAVGGAIRVINDSQVNGGYVEQINLPKEWLSRFQLLEYLRAFLAARVAMAHSDMLLLISGAFGIFRRSVLVEIGGYDHSSLGEDFELVTRIHRYMREEKRAYKIDFVPEVVCWTEVPFDYEGIRNQRTRWEQGGLQTLSQHRKMLFNRKYGRAGLLAMPMVLLEDLIGPPMELVGYLLIPLLFFLGLLPLSVMLAFLAITVLYGTAMSLGALVLEETQLRRTPSSSDLLLLGITAVIENFGYRQMVLYFRIRGMWKYWRKETGWASAKRKGFSN